MEKRQKDLLRTLVTQLRQTLLGTNGASGEPVRGDLDRELERLGIASDGAITPLDALVNPTSIERRARRCAEAQLAGLPATDRPAARREIVERAGYTWINRLLALRAMEARGLIDRVLRSDPAYGGLSEALYILRQTQPARTAGADAGWWAVVEDACRSHGGSLPGLFDLDDLSAALRPSTQALLICVSLMGSGPAGFTLDECDAALRDPDAIGWSYQFYQEEAKARIDAKVKSGGKVESRAEIAAKTELFTEPYMVKWLLQNSLGRTYHELYPDSTLPKTWEYYIRPDDLRPPPAERERGPSSLEELTLMDPCMGSGHFEREAFDMLAAMYRERYPAMGAREIADAALSRHLHGIDIDPRAAQLAALTLYLRAWELVRDERRAQRLPGAGSYSPPALNLATTPTGLTPGALERHLERHPEDKVFEPLLRGVFAALEQAPILGSLLQPAEHLDEAIRAFQRRARGQLGLFPEHVALNQLLEELGRHDPVQLRGVLLDRVARSFEREAQNAADVPASLFEREAGVGLLFLELLDRRYAVVATNPPYLGSRNMEPALKQYIELRYPVGKRDLYSAFILRCVDLCLPRGKSALVTPNTWGTQTSYADLRADLLARASFLFVAQLGRHAFGEADPPGYPHLFVVGQQPPAQDHAIESCEHPVSMASADQALLLAEVAKANRWNRTSQLALTRIAGTPLLLSVADGLLDLMTTATTLGDYARVPKGMSTAENQRFLRFGWEVSNSCRWTRYAKGGAFAKWRGLAWYRVDYEAFGARLRASGRAVLRNQQFYCMPGLTYTEVARGQLGVRELAADTLFDARSPGIFTTSVGTHALLAVLNARPTALLFRLLSPGILLDQAYAPSVPVLIPQAWATLERLGRLVVMIKGQLLASEVLEGIADSAVQDGYAGILSTASVRAGRDIQSLSLCIFEAQIERLVMNQPGLEECQDCIYKRTGVPAGFYPPLTGYDRLPPIPAGLDMPSLQTRLNDELAQLPRQSPVAGELARMVSSLRLAYQRGPALVVEEEKPESDAGYVSEDEEQFPGAIIPIPPETFLEELSQKLQIHPISVYWLLEGLRAEGVRCKPEEQRILEDRLSVLVLRVLGHRWPKQIEAGEPVPDWADPDGIVPLTPGTGEFSVAERLRERLRSEDGPLGAQHVEALLVELTGQDLETWLSKSFFPRHVRQFKHRPIAWHLASVPRGKKKSARRPAFECLLYYHACAGDVLARLRVHYLEPLLNAARGQAQHARASGGETGAAQAAERVAELEEFSSKLRQVEVEGFACPEMEEYVQQEPLGRWSGDGVFGPASRAELLAQEKGWHVDINDGVRVNIAPLQQAGLLASNVLNGNDLRKAIGDRTRWRSDERRWVREGVLPRCGWMDESVPESPRWTERAPEREAARRRLEEKRRALLARLESGAPAPAEESEGDDQLPRILAE